jgi:16S rRNA (cytosine967-C5)-methyltransferase
VLCAVTARGAYANLMLPALLAERGLGGRDAALATELTYGTLRGLGTYDAIIAACCDRGLADIDAPVLEVLRLGTHQLLATRVRAHAAVATSVDLARSVAGPRPAGFVNAVLRRVAGRDLDDWLRRVAPGRAQDLTGHLAIRYSHPRWVVTALREALGETGPGAAAQTEAALAADGAPGAIALCAVPGLAEPGELTAAGLRPARWSPYGGYLAGGDPAGIAAVAEGRAGVQDEASQLAALALTRVGVEGGDGRWLDMCAGPGGKARLLAGLAAGRGARLLAADLRQHRAVLADRAIAASGAGAAAVADGTAPGWRPAAFDRVLADVPCSGLGALRRRPDARWRRTPDDVATLAALQRRLLDAALDSARPGGVVGYVTCSPHLAETREVVTAVLAGRGDAEVLDAPGVLSEVPDLRCAEPCGRFAQFWPHRHDTDAIFLALLRKTARAA